MLLYEVPNIIKIFYEEENNLIVHEWFVYNPKDQDYVILSILNEIYKIHLAYPIEKLIVKTEQTKGVFSADVQKFIKDIQFPRLVSDTKIKYVATVKTKETLKSMGTILWQKQLKKEDEVIINNVGSEEEARAWLNSVD